MKKILMFSLLTCLLLLSSWTSAEFVRPLVGIKVCLDAGLGGELYPGPDKDDVVTTGLKSTESRANVIIVLFLREFFQKAGAEVVLTRETYAPPFPSAEQRVKICHDSEAQYFISIHHDYSKNPDINYIHGIYNEAAYDVDFVSELLRAVASAFELQIGGAKAQSLPFLSDIRVPNIAISCGFITNIDFQNNIKSISFNRRQARAVFQGFMNYYEKKVKPTPVPTPIVTPEETPAYPLKPFRPTPTPSASPTLGLKPLAPVAPTPPVAPPTPTPAASPTIGLKPLAPVAPPAQPEAVFEVFSPPFLNPVNGQVDQTLIFGEQWGEWTLKKGISFNVPLDTPVMACADGTAMVVAPARKSDNVVPYNNTVIIKHNQQIAGKDVYTHYGNLREIKVTEGQAVKAGDIIGTTGRPFLPEERREEELEFEVRIGGHSQDYVQNPELFIKHINPNTGVIVGRIIDGSGRKIAGLRIDAAVKPEACERYLYSMTYGQGINGTEQWDENFAICDVVPGEYFLETQYGVKRAVVQANMVVFLEWITE